MYTAPLAGPSITSISIMSLGPAASAAAVAAFLFLGGIVPHHFLSSQGNGKPTNTPAEGDSRRGWRGRDLSEDRRARHAEVSEMPRRGATKQDSGSAARASGRASTLYGTAASSHVMSQDVATKRHFLFRRGGRCSLLTAPHRAHPHLLDGNRRDTTCAQSIGPRPVSCLARTRLARPC